jgi:predicted nucleic acid-binding protein
MFVVDTNILAYSADPDSEFYLACRRRVEIWREQTSPWYVTWNICYEFLRLCTHPRVFRRPWTVTQGWRFLESIFDSPSAGILLPTARHLALLGEVIAELPQLRGNILHDAHTAVLMREHGIKEIYTHDTDFHRFPFVRVIDPVAE